MSQTKTESIREKPEDLRWLQVSAAGQPLGRLASRIARVLRGKHKPTFTPNADNGDFVIVTDAEKVTLTGAKWRDKIYYRHSGYPGGLKAESARHLRERRPEVLIQRAVQGMLPHNALGRKMAKKLKVYVGPAHPHAAQHPEQLEI